MSWHTNGGGGGRAGGQRGDRARETLQLQPGTSRPELQMSWCGGRESSLIEALAPLALGQGKLPENH